MTPLSEPEIGGVLSGSSDQIIEAGCYCIEKFIPVMENYISCKIGTRGPDDDDDFEVKFLKNLTQDGFVFPDREDIASAKRLEIVSVLSEPLAVAAHKPHF